MSMKSKMLSAMALLTLIGALFVMQSAERNAPTADAATGSIAALNVGTCLTTDATVFHGNCEGLHGDSGSGSWEIRDKIAEVKTLYATYAHDPKTQSEAPRAILKDSDLLKISITDAGRDKRTGVLIEGTGVTAPDTADGDGKTYTALQAINEFLGRPSDDPIDWKKDTSGDRDGVRLNVNGSNDTILSNSGVKTLNFAGATGNKYAPMGIGGTIRFFGCISDRDECVVDNDGGTPERGEFQELKAPTIAVDEDAGEGKNGGDVNTAPWLQVLVSLSEQANLNIYAIYYETSDEESLVGGHKYYHCPSGYTLYQDDQDDKEVWRCDDDNVPSTEDTKASSRSSMDDVVYTKDEMEDNEELLVRASADGDLEERHVNLHLKETGRFSGVYQGYVRLTDANGDGKDDSDPKKTDITDWGRKVTDGEMSGIDCAGAAVLAVESGPVTIEYRDSDGSRQTLRIEIDNVAPTISVTSPADGSSSGDQTPDFAGNFEDADSGLIDESFRLVVDNQVDGDDGKNVEFALDRKTKVPDASEVTTAKDQVSSIQDYSGYGMGDADPTQFGIVKPNDLYDLGDDSCSDDQPVCHILSEEYDDGASQGTFDDSLRLDLYEKGGESLDVRDREFEIDFQAFVMDMAGNIGFSDADPANPRYINDLGKKDGDRKAPNVLGYYSAHIITLDEKDPMIMSDQAATGYYGRNSDNHPIADRAGIMVVFDGPIAANSVSNYTFSVELDDGSDARIVDHRVDGKYVFLKLDSELASDATPKIDIVDGEKVEDAAGNETFGKEQREIEVADGISPELTVTLSEGSGTGTGDEGPDKLTKDQITIHVSSDEPLQGQPQIAVVCSSLRWNEGENANVKKDIRDFVANRNTTASSRPEEMPAKTSNKSEEYAYTCGYEVDNIVKNFEWSPVPALSRPGENWVYTWKKPTGEAGVVPTALGDGKLTAVVFARDRSRYPDPKGGKDVQNWGSTSAEFTLDTELKTPVGNDLQPSDGDEVKEARPFVLIDFPESTTVTLKSAEIDGVEKADQFTRPDHNRFLYWPLSLSQGEHEVEVTAADAAGNEESFEYRFTVKERGDFVLALNAGWNAISVPADPLDTAIGAVFTDSDISTVIGWDTQGWRLAIRRDGVWESNQQYATLNEIRSQYGYWVKSDGFVRQTVKLKGGTSRDSSGTPTLRSIPTEPGWNFVGVIDQDGDQTEDHFGIGLQDSSDRPIAAAEYLGKNYIRAYTWDATFSRFDGLRPDMVMTIGDGVWVYYPEGTGIAP
jgi:hypothetical protein